MKIERLLHEPHSHNQYFEACQQKWSLTSQNVKNNKTANKRNGEGVKEGDTYLVLVGSTSLANTETSVENL